MSTTNVFEQVQERYAQGARERQEALCCPVDYDQSLLAALPQEIIDKDYGCGDPSRYIRAGDRVLDLGSGGGKICYMAAQLVGAQGSVTGVDMTDDMLALARKYQAPMARVLGGDRVSFKKGYIQDLALDVAAMETYLAAQPVSNALDLQRLSAWRERQRRESPLIADCAMTLVISNCVLNLVAENDRRRMIDEIYRVLAPGGRVAISDIVADEPVPEVLKNDPELWSGCIAGAFHEAAFLDAFVEAGFVGVAYDKWEAKPWQVVEGIEFRAVTLIATRPLTDEDYDGGHAVLYKGPYAEVRDEKGRIYVRGQRMAVSRCTYETLMNGSHADDFIGFAPQEAKNRGAFCKPAGATRSAVETKGTARASSSCC